MENKQEKDLEDEGGQVENEIVLLEECTSVEEESFPIAEVVLNSKQTTESEKNRVKFVNDYFDENKENKSLEEFVSDHPEDIFESQAREIQMEAVQLAVSVHNREVSKKKVEQTETEKQRENVIKLSRFYKQSKRIVATKFPDKQVGDTEFESILKKMNRNKEAKELEKKRIEKSKPKEVSPSIRQIQENAPVRTLNFKRRFAPKGGKFTDRFNEEI